PVATWPASKHTGHSGRNLGRADSRINIISPATKATPKPARTTPSIGFTRYQWPDSCLLIPTKKAAILLIRRAGTGMPTPGTIRSIGSTPLGFMMAIGPTGKEMGDHGTA